MELGAGNLTGGIWGSFGLNDDASGNELDLWVSYDFGPLALTVTNYSFLVLMERTLLEAFLMEILKLAVPQV